MNLIMGNVESHLMTFIEETVFSDIIWSVGLRENGSCTIWPGGLEFEGPYVDISIGFNRILGVKPDGAL